MKRKGSSTTTGIPPEILAGLNGGTLETATLAEGLAVDFALLIRTVAPEVGEPGFRNLAQASGLGVTRRMALVADLLLDTFGDGVFERLGTHASDTVRGWVCYAVGRKPGLAVETRLDLIRRFADDPHFGVREWAWLAVRPAIAENLDAAIRILSGWATSESERVRRFASEATRPRGVWCSHIEALKRQPELGLPILGPLRSDPARYVQDSVGNWLNDAAKTAPEWVRSLCLEWESDSPATRRICSRGLRSLSE